MVFEKLIRDYEEAQASSDNLQIELPADEEIVISKHTNIMETTMIMSIR
jgi:hypothetical protein